VEIADSARRHGVEDPDIEHAVHNAIRVLDQHDRSLYIGADRTSTYDDRPEEMTMPRTQAQLQQAADDAERWLESLDPAAIASPEADASRLRRISSAVKAAAASQAELVAAVAAAREHGHTWTQIATMLGTSRQAAQERYGQPARRQ